MPTAEQTCKGPFKVDEKTDKVIGINQHYMELLFRLMPAIAGVQVWRGAARCQRDPAYSRHSIKVGTFNELVTTTDQIFACWAYCNFIDSVLDVCGGTGSKKSLGGELNVPEALSVTGKWTSQAVGRSWTLAGQQKWNTLSKAIRSAWGTSDVLEMEDGARMGATSVFRKRFTSRWMSLHHGVVPGVKATTTKKHQEDGAEEDDDDIDGFGEPSVEAMDLLTHLGPASKAAGPSGNQRACCQSEGDGKILSEDLDARNY